VPFVKKMNFYLTQTQAELTESIVIIRANANKNNALLSEMKIDELPTLLLYENIEVKWKHSSFKNDADLRKQLQ
jgi:hypothetical protein